MGRHVIRAAAFVCMLTVSAPLAAQTFRGTVVDDSTGRPLDNATVTALDAKGQPLDRPAARTDSLGRFTLHIGVQGKYQLRVNRIGYLPLTSNTVTFNGGLIVTVTLRLTASAIKLGTIVVTESRRLNRLELMSITGYELRKSRGLGLFLDTLDLKQFNRFPLSWLLEDYSAGPRLYEIWTRQWGPMLVMQKGLSYCHPQMLFDGFPASNGNARLLGLGADQVYGIEVYNRVTMPPPSIGADIDSPTCGSIVVWTKAFAEEMKKKGLKPPPPPR